MYANETAAEILGVTPDALAHALGRGETIASITASCGLDVRAMTEAVVDAELADIEALAVIAGFAPDAVDDIVADMRAYVVAVITDGAAAAEARFSGTARLVAA